MQIIEYFEYQESLVKLFMNMTSKTADNTFYSPEKIIYSHQLEVYKFECCLNTNYCSNLMINILSVSIGATERSNLGPPVVSMALISPSPLMFLILYIFKIN